MFPSIDPQKMAQVQSVSKNIKAVITINHEESKATIALSSADPQAAQIIPGLLDQFVEGLATQLQSFFAIQGEIIVVRKKQ